MIEKIICSGIWFDDGIIHEHQPVNIKTGYVVCGRRHHNCFATCHIMQPNHEYVKHEKEQGFLTNLDRFVDRKDAAIIAYNSGQISKSKITLYSEDLW